MFRDFYVAVSRPAALWSHLDETVYYFISQANDCRVGIDYCS